VLELYHGKLALMPLSSKMDFCEFCVAWSGKHGGNDKPRVASAQSLEGGEEKWRRVPLPWELFHLRCGSSGTACWAPPTPTS
jgi:hypothetical protein